MNLTSIKDALHSGMTTIGTFFTNNGPEIAVGFGAAGILTTAGLSIWGTVKAVRAVDKCKEEKNEKKEDFTVKDVVKVSWKYYIPAGLTASLSLTSLLLGYKAQFDKSATLATAYALSENTLAEYKKKVVDAIGKEKEDKIEQEIAEERVNRDIKINDIPVIANDEDVLCYDALTGRFYASSINKIKEVILQLNTDRLLNGDVALNDYYYGVGLAGVKIGENMGWRQIDQPIEASFRSGIAEDNRPYIYVSFDVVPLCNYTNRF